MNEKYFPRDNHTLVAGYLFWVFGFTGAHRFYFGKPVTGTIWFLTFGMLGVGWFVDLFLIPGMEKEAEIKYISGPNSYNISWALLTFLGFFEIYLRYYLVFNRWSSYFWLAL